jgi:hypothetical protein
LRKASFAFQYFIGVGKHRADRGNLSPVVPPFAVVYYYVDIEAGGVPLGEIVATVGECSMPVLRYAAIAGKNVN